MTTNLELVIFDCDGVLIDSEILSQRVLLALLKDKGVDADADYFKANFLGRTFENVTTKVAHDYSVVLDDSFRQLFREELFKTFDKELRRTEQITTVLDKLCIPSCVATSSSPARVNHALKVAGLSDYFTDCVFTASEVEYGKPAPDIFLHAAKKMGVNPKNCIVFEDSVSGIKGGLAAGMQVVQFNGASHMQGQGDIALCEDATVMQSWSNVIEHFPHLFK